MNQLISERHYELFLNKDIYEHQRTFSKEQACNMTDLKIALCQGRIKLSDHACMDSARKRGYSSNDIKTAIWTGVQTEFQRHRAKRNAVVEGFDEFKNPICVIVGMRITEDEVKREIFEQEQFTVVTLFPPIRDKFLRKIA